MTITLNKFSTDDSSSGTFTLINGSTEGRTVAVAAMQNRGPANLDSVTLNGVAPDRLEYHTLSTGDSRRAFVAYWANDSLPAAPGDYAFVFNSGCSAVFYEMSEWDKALPEILIGEKENTSTPYDITFPSSDADTVLLGTIATEYSQGSFTGLDGTVFDKANSIDVGYVFSKLDSTNPRSLNWEGPANTFAYAAIAFKAAAVSVTKHPSIKAEDQGVPIEATDWEITATLESSGAVIYDQTGIFSTSSGVIAAAPVTGGEPGNAIWITGRSKLTNKAFYVPATLEES